MSSIVLLSGSPSTRSRAHAVLEYASRAFAAAGLKNRIFGVPDFPAEDLVLARYDSAAFDVVKSAVEQATGVVVSTPVYKAAYSGGLKTLLDILPQTALRTKTVLPIACGGTPAHQLSIDYALKPVLSALGASDIHQGVYLVDKQLTVNADGTLSFDDEIKARLDAALAQIILQVKARVPLPAQPQA